MTTEHFTETTGSLARKAEVGEHTVRVYADENLIEYVRIANGQRLFKPSAAARVRELFIERMARRGRPAATNAA